MKEIIYGKYFKCTECDKETEVLRKDESIPSGWMIRFGQGNLQRRYPGENDIVYCPEHAKKYMAENKLIR